MRASFAGAAEAGLILPGVVEDADFAGYVAERLAGLPGVTAVALGGSRASGTQRPDSDWDFSLYYRGQFDPGELRSLGWPGEIFPVGGWGGGVFNGGAWLRVDGRAVDVHYRDLDDIEFHLAEAREGRYRVERLLFHLAGVPTYIVVGELAVNVVLHGELPPAGSYPDRLREAAHRAWLADALRTLGYARAAYAARGNLAQTAGAIALAFTQAAHAALAARGEWVTNEKALLDRAGLRAADDVLAGLRGEPDVLIRAVDDAVDLIRAISG